MIHFLQTIIYCNLIMNDISYHHITNPPGCSTKLKVKHNRTWSILFLFSTNDLIEVLPHPNDQLEI